MRTRSTIAWLLVAACTVAATASGQQRPARTGSPEAATARRFAAIRDEPVPLLAFLRRMPKGGDLHNHLSGAIYAESYLRWAAEDGLCLAVATMTIVTGPCDADAGRPPVASVLQNAAVYNQAIDAMSMRNWNPSRNGHDHFFATFGKFDPPSEKTGEMLAEATARAASERLTYLELMLTPDRTPAALGRTTGWDQDLGRLRERLLAAGLKDTVVGRVRQRLDAAEARQRELLRCGTPQADAGCAVTVRYIAQVGRSAAKEVVFAQMLAWFELVGAEPRVVSLNLVQPEDDPTAVRDFSLHMSMLDFLHRHYPRVPIALHAGELGPRLVPPETLRFHMRASIETGHARRIGHGAAIMYEDDSAGLLREMAAKKILVEVALSSAEWILGVAAKRHPLRIFLQHGVPVALVTDDLGVSRSSHTYEFVKAVEDHGLDYLMLKRMVRNSIEYSFADATTKARLKTELERDLGAFEREQSAGVPGPER
jgi:hypothetical protein